MASAVTEKLSARPKCGIIMPIAAMDGCSERHWSDVREILGEAIEAAGLEPNLVSDANEVGFINKRIVQNIYENPIVICDVSAKNPNVMFELGMRLAFDKPTLIVKDDLTTYSFDISGIEHVGYPRDLRFQKIREFKEKVETKLRATLAAASEDPSYTTFLKHFGEFTVAKLDQKEVSGEQYILEELKSIREAVARLQRPSTKASSQHTKTEPTNYLLTFRKKSRGDVDKSIDTLRSLPDVVSVELLGSSADSVAFLVYLRPNPPKFMLELIKEVSGADEIELIG